MFTLKPPKKLPPRTRPIILKAGESYDTLSAPRKDEVDLLLKKQPIQSQKITHDKTIPALTTKHSSKDVQPVLSLEELEEFTDTLCDGEKRGLAQG